MTHVHSRGSGPGGVAGAGTPVAARPADAGLGRGEPGGGIEQADRQHRVAAEPLTRLVDPLEQAFRGEPTQADGVLVDNGDRRHQRLADEGKRRLEGCLHAIDGRARPYTDVR